MSSALSDASEAPRSIRPVPARNLVAVGSSAAVESSRRLVRVGLVTGSELIAHGVTSMLGPYGYHIVLVDVTCAPEDVDLVLLDCSLAHDAGLSRCRDLIQAGFSSVVLFDWGLTLSEEQRFRDAGVRGHLSMRLGAPDLVSALESVHAELGRRGSTRLLPSPTGSIAESGPVRHGALREIGCSAREAQVLTLICRGRTNLEIAEELFLSVNTVKTYIRTAYRKIGLTSRTRVVLWGTRHGVV